MAAGISAFGERGISGVLGWDNNEVHRKVYLQDPANQFLPLMQKIFGDGASSTPQEFSSNWGIQGFYAYSVAFDTGADRGAQGETAAQGNFGLLDSMPTMRGGVTLDITYRPMDASQQGGGISLITDEAWDFSTQTMSLIGNNYGQKYNPLRWDDGGGMDNQGTPLTNLTAIVKLIPKVELVQRRFYCINMPSATQRALIGSINNSPINIGAAGGGNTVQWPESCVLLVGLPTIRRWRFDGKQIFEIGVKLAINMYQDTIEDGSNNYVTWNRLYRVSAADKAAWTKVLVGNNKDPLYPGVDLTQVTHGF